MATTALFVEILIVGLEAGAWLSLLILTIVGPVTVDPKALKNWATLLTALGLAATYVLGILVDRAADSAYDWFATTRAGKAANRYMGENSNEYRMPAAVAKMRMTVMHASEGMAKFLDYQRSRMRIARATVFNLAAALPVAALYLTVRVAAAATVEAKAGAVLLLVAAWIPLMLLGLFAAERIASAYVKRLSDAYRILTGGKFWEA